MMKSSYPFAFLVLFLLLLILPHKSTAFLSFGSSVKQFFKNSYVKGTLERFFDKSNVHDVADIVKKLRDSSNSNPPPLSPLPPFPNSKTPPPPPEEERSFNTAPPPPPTPVKIKGLKEIKHYFAEFGYINDPSNFLMDDYLDDETISAVKTFQKYFNDNTLEHLSLPRCAVPDLNVIYELNSETNVSWPQGIRWFPNGTRTKHLTYAFLPDSEVPSNAKKAFSNAFKRWSKALTELNHPQFKLNFTELSDYNTSNIKIGFYDFDHLGIEDVVIGGTIIRYENGSYGSPIVGDIRLDGTLYWVLPGSNLTTWSWKDGEFDLENVAMHQIGHILGLKHSSNEESVMYPYIKKLNETKVELTDDDKNNLQSVYSINSTINNHVSGCRGRFTLFAFGYWSFTTATTLSLGLFVLLLF